MGIVGEGIPDYKSQLVAEICAVSARHCHFYGPCNTKKLPFIDWYLILQVEENADLEAIRKQYHKFALNLHPDKNKHPKADIAFKLVLEAYTCLSDKAKRIAFDMERCNILHAHLVRSKTSRASKYYIEQQRSYSATLQCVRQVRERFVEEVRVIENCLRAYRTRGELPIFDPSNTMSHAEYPHHRTHQILRKADKKLYNTRSFTKFNRSYNHKTASFESPIFEIGQNQHKFSCLSSATIKV